MCSPIRPNPTETCIAIADWWFYGPVALSLSALSYKLFVELAKVQDSINMSKEVRSAVFSWVATASEWTIVLGNMYRD